MRTFSDWQRQLSPDRIAAKVESFGLSTRQKHGFVARQFLALVRQNPSESPVETVHAFVVSQLDCFMLTTVVGHLGCLRRLLNDMVPNPVAEWHARQGGTLEEILDRLGGRREKVPPQSGFHSSLANDFESFTQYRIRLNRKYSRDELRVLRFFDLA